MDKEVEVFKKKEVMNREELENNVETLSQITANLESAVTELEVIDTALRQSQMF